MGYPPRTPWESTGGMTTIGNAMIAPLGAYAFRGVLWYQGESDTDRADSYAARLALLMREWRQRFGEPLLVPGRATCRLGPAGRRAARLRVR